MGRDQGQDIEIPLEPFKQRGRRPFDPGAGSRFPAPQVRNGTGAQVSTGDRSRHRPTGVAIPTVQEGPEEVRPLTPFLFL